MRNGPSAASLNSVANTKLLLIEVCEQPGKFLEDAGLIDALSSQGKLASFVKLDREISGVSLNAFKRAANIELERGFVEIDELRIAALKAVGEAKATSDKINKRSVSGLEATIDELRGKLAKALEDCTHLTDAFYASIGGANLALKALTLQDAREDWQKSMPELFKRLSLAERYGKGKELKKNEGGK
jgi:hypothetical protein